MGRASRAKRRRRDAEERRLALSKAPDPDDAATWTLAGVVALVAVAVVTGWWSDTRVGPGGTQLGALVGRRNPELLTLDVPDGRLALVAAALTLPAVVLALLGRRATRRATTTSRLTGIAAVVAVVVAPAVVSSYVAAALGAAADGWWMVVTHVWPVPAAFVATFCVWVAADGIRPRRGPART
ncbi:hypothetical protein J1G44_15790 [Cellulomonas sp. zg-ZUI199]|uniref:Uncharacterized protein n=1 Tax=Cellulomonas wangleii TaxID=2816956 RepID=A0ABX8D747_9CELL|nr:MULTISPECIES: hypothetical protein [Cellulomonas]MBO0901636.1 hypothetical protein [Cellulomonas sp. zg-ZUI22]MBO0925940.1 hypothetical protein [Cellulomonas wangleii]QVI63244.1 hypothetical protein KG103_04925 [Cellulomonas wangleii]